MTEVCYYSTQDLLNDYATHGVHPHLFISKGFSPKYLDMAQKLGSDLVSQREKRYIKSTPAYIKMMSFPPVAYHRTKEGNFYHVSSDILNKFEIREHEEYIASLEEPL